VTPELAGLIVSMVATVVALAAYRASRADRGADRLGAVDGRLDDMGKRLTRVETQLEPFWAAVQQDMIRLLHHPWPERAGMDALLDKLDPGKPGRLTGDERAELKGILRQVIESGPGRPPPFPVSPDERVAAVFLLHTMDLVRQ
jgi:hypothetical protein